MFSLLAILISFVYLIIAISIHEFAHAYAADRLGDPTARSQGRLTLNPLAHIDPIGTIVLPLSLMLLSGGTFAYGWGKATPFDPYNLQNPRKDTAIISIAGPISNILLALFGAILIRLVPHTYSLFILPLITTNIALAVFNLIPVGPLDGQKILFGILPRDLAYEFQSIMNRYGTLILILMIFPIFGGEAPVSAIMSPIMNFFFRLLLP
jgi:Zn-dependent protease